MMDTSPDSLLTRFLLALMVWREARGESARGKRLVAQVAVNRAHDARQRWPTTVREVVLQPFQFSSFLASDPQVTRYPAPDTVWEACVQAADAALQAGADPCGGINHYYAETLAQPPYWTRGHTPTVVEGHHRFYAL